jgi:hypothetical protein
MIEQIKRDAFVELYEMELHYHEELVWYEPLDIPELPYGYAENREITMVHHR